MDSVAPADPGDALSHFLHTHRWQLVQGARGPGAPRMVHNLLGLLVMGSAPPRGKAEEWARGDGAHRYVHR